MNSLMIAIAPVVIIAWYIWARDKYEKEPAWMLIKSLIAGALIVIPVVFMETWLMSYGAYIPVSGQAAYNGFVVAACTEELFKFLAVMLLIWPNKNFNEKYDGIVYASFISLGFAGIENVMYVFNFGMEVAYLRAITAVPAHALFGIYMGYQLGIAKFERDKRAGRIVLALLIPIIFHGIYDYLLMTGKSWALLVFVPFVVYMWIRGFRRLKKHSNASPFKYN